MANGTDAQAGGGGGSPQTTGPSVITSPQDDTRVLNHRGTEVGSSNVTRSQNTASSNSEILLWTIPKKFKRLVIAGGKHWTKAELRTKETASGDGTTTTFSLSENLIAIAGEEDVADQPFPVVVAYDTDASSELTVDSVDYENDQVTFASAPNNATDNIEMWPVLGDGTIQMRGLDGFGNVVGPLNEWGVPVHVFADFNQEKNTTQIHLPGAGRFQRDEQLQVLIDAPRQIVWSDGNYPQGQYVSRLEQRVDVSV